MVTPAFASAWQVLLDNAPGSAGCEPGALVRLEKQADVFILQSWHAASAAFRVGDTQPALCAWRDRCSHVRTDARAARGLKWTGPPVAWLLRTSVLSCELYNEVTHRFAMECGNSSLTFGCEEELPHFFYPRLVCRERFAPLSLTRDLRRGVIH